MKTFSLILSCNIILNFIRKIYLLFCTHHIRWFSSGFKNVLCLPFFSLYKDNRFKIPLQIASATLLVIYISSLFWCLCLTMICFFFVIWSLYWFLKDRKLVYELIRYLNVIVILISILPCTNMSGLFLRMIQR